jgi:hypothetical protein
MQGCAGVLPRFVRQGGPSGHGGTGAERHRGLLGGHER